MNSQQIESQTGLHVETVAAGASLTRIQIPGDDGRAINLVLGCADVEGYRAEHPFFGSIVGRHSNRITNARFVLDGRLYRLKPNVGEHHLHGGPLGFGVREWDLVERTCDAVTYALTSEDGDQGYPGRVDATTCYRLRGNTLLIDIRATTDAPTVVCMAPHPYFNLSGAPNDAKQLGEHRLTLNADRYLPISPELLQQGEIASVAETPFDLRDGALLTQDRLAEPHQQLTRAGGIDHHFLLAEDGPVDAEGLRTAARLEHVPSGRRVDISTNQSGIQVYTGNALDYTPGIEGRAYGRHQAVCIEPQGYPDAPNHANYESTRLDPGETYRSLTALSIHW